MIFKKIGRGLLDALSPPSCVICGELSKGVHPHFCPECLASFEPVGTSCCTLCGEPFPAEQTPHRCLRCLGKHGPEGQCRSLFLYRGSVAAAVSWLKYRKNFCVLDPVVEKMLAAVQEMEPFPCAEVVVPVPISRRGLWGRGFNQSAVLAEPLGRLIGARVEKGALRKKGSGKQVGLGKKERVKNARSSFTAGRRIHRIDGKRVLLFDDVYTTGATVRFCAGILRRHGASVSILTLARRAPENIEHLTMDKSVGGEDL
jgi:ComF family protein